MDGVGPMFSSTRQRRSSFIGSKKSGKAIFEQFYAQPLARILKPFFFTSIGFSVPISEMFRGAIDWRVVIYTVLMCISKLTCGL